MDWKNSEKIGSKSFDCGYCGESLASEKGYVGTIFSNGSNRHAGSIYICHHCHKPTFFDFHRKNKQTPGPRLGRPVKHISHSEVNELFEEARTCYSFGGYTSAVMCCRKLLMNIAVSEGAKKNLYFADYVNYLEKNNFIPPKGKKWVDSIRLLGNEANHEIEFKSAKEAMRILTFTEMLLRFIYELPGMLEDSEEET